MKLVTRAFLTRIPFNRANKTFVPLITRDPRLGVAPRLSHSSYNKAYQSFDSPSNRQSFKDRPPSFCSRNRWILILSVCSTGLLFYYWYPIESVPFTDRKRFIIRNDSMMKVMSERSELELLHEYQGRIVPKNHPVYSRIYAILRRLDGSIADMVAGLASSGPESRLAEGEYLSRVATPHTVHIVKLPLPNAMVLPNGTIFIFTGLLNLNLSDAELAGVLAHELSHQLLEHSMERLSFTQFISVVTFLLQGVIGFEDTLSRYVLKVFSSLILELPHSRRTEREADTVGLQVLAGACFEPRAVISFWQKMDQFERMKETLANDPDAVGDLSGTTPASSHHASFMTLLSTHPGHGERKNYLLREMDKAQSIYDTRCSPSATVGRWF